MSEELIEYPRRRGIYLLPNLFTMGALFAGFYAIVAATKHYYDNAAIAILVAILLDGVDGRLARLTHTVSDLELTLIVCPICFVLVYLQLWCCTVGLYHH